MTSLLTSEKRFYDCDSLLLDTKKVKSQFVNKQKKDTTCTSTPTFVENKAFENYNAFYNNNNYIYPDEYTKKSEWSVNEPELPEWYHTEFDQEIVNEVYNEYELFYNPYLSVEMEQNIEDEYQRQNEIIESESSDSEGEWCNVD